MDKATMLLIASVFATLTSADSWKDCETCPEVVAIEPGSFTMGRQTSESLPEGYPEQRAEAEQPAHRVTIATGFAIGRYELTRDEFAVFAEETGFETDLCFLLRDPTWLPDSNASWLDPGFPVTGRSPATCLSHDDFARYLSWLSEKTGAIYRFPTEAEWEYVASVGAAGRPLPIDSGPKACRHLNGADQSFAEQVISDWAPGQFECRDGFARAAPVGSFAPNALGLYDMFGNVSEWTADCFYNSHDGAPGDGTARQRNPCTARPVKGGSWAGGPPFFRPAVRVGTSTAVRGDGHGLRVVREL